MITKSKITEIFVLPMISAKNLMQRWQKTLFNQHLMPQNDVASVWCRTPMSSQSSSVSTSTPTATSSIITRPTCALFGRLWSEGIHVVTGLRSNMKQRLMPLYDKIMLRRGALSRPWTTYLKTWCSLCTRHRSVHNFLINLLAAMGRTASSSPSQQSTSTTRCRTQTVDSPFGNSSNLIFSKAHRAATFMVARHYIRIRITPFQSTLIPNSRC